ncbi:LLM class flavin-dependent oxidoreductase [Micromonospora sp. KC213]|uniref:LLM class flavin-dependent oxidoreductase n=1 Tax=Micromonospora sp. KC213 TaxID=2530378 RepID=UPI00104451CA|nr:LLM class flavin-dependent oxidoreductase [Micromonospora sp. KC213]TDC41254.1 LLM class flavin-dependent oxidoreductase [Micromonospora sp. KC213]
MTADLPAPRRAGRGVDAHLFLLAGQHPGASHSEALADAHAYALAAEAAGWAGVWLAEHHFVSYGVCPSATAFAGYLLGATARITVGTAACVLSDRHPVALAEEAVLLDTLSGGRFRLGVGRGGPWVDLEVFGTGLGRYTDGFADALDVLGRWTSGAATVSGNSRFPFRPVPVVPRPTRALPVWVAATSPPTVELAARHGFPLLLGMHADLPEKAAMLERYARVAARHGHDPGRVPHASAHLAYLADSDEQAARAVRAGLPGLLAGAAEHQRIDGSSGPGRDPLRYTEHLIDIHPVGAPVRCRAAVARAAALPGVRHLLFMVEAAADRGRTLRTIDRFAAEVLQAGTGATGSSAAIPTNDTMGASVTPAGTAD